MLRTLGLRLALPLLVGVALGLYVGWVVIPVRTAGTSPAELQQTFKDDYILMLASAYSADGDAARARAGLVRLGLKDAGTAVTDAAARLEAAGYPASDLKVMAALAAVIQSGVGAATPVP